MHSTDKHKKHKEKPTVERRKTFTFLQMKIMSFIIMLIRDYSTTNKVVDSVFIQFTLKSSCLQLKSTAPPPPPPLKMRKELTTNQTKHTLVHTKNNHTVTACYQLIAGLLGFLVMGAMLPLYKWTWTKMEMSMPICSMPQIQNCIGDARAMK